MTSLWYEILPVTLELDQVVWLAVEKMARLIPGVSRIKLVGIQTMRC